MKFVAVSAAKRRRRVKPISIAVSPLTILRTAQPQLFGLLVSQAFRQRALSPRSSECSGSLIKDAGM